VGRAEGPGIVGIKVMVTMGRTEVVVVEDVGICDGRVLGLLVGPMLGLNVGFVLKLGLLVGIIDGTIVTVGITEDAA